MIVNHIPTFDFTTLKPGTCIIRPLPTGEVIEVKDGYFDLPDGYTFLVCRVTGDQQGESLFPHTGHTFVIDVDIPGSKISNQVDRIQTVFQYLEDILEPFVSEPYMWISPTSVKGVFLPNWYEYGYPQLIEYWKKVPAYTHICIHSLVTGTIYICPIQ